MRLFKSVLLAAPLLALAAADARDADACGGCFHNDIMQMENTQVSGHRMILSVSKTQSTLWDQIQYVGNPSSFAWVLPIKGQVNVGISSDALFENLEALTQVTINSPTINCPPPQFCNGAAFGSAGTGGSAGSGGVMVIAEEVVGPYETVQLSSQDPQALKTWLAMHNYVVPADVAPIIDAYVADGFDFLALKLVPGMGIQSMKPVRVTTPGANAVLPLRMVAAGTGASVPITLWVMGEAGYVPQNFPTFTIDENQLVWDWDKQQSNYTALRQQGFAMTQNKGWLIEASEPFTQFTLTNILEDLAMYDPTSSGYGDDKGMGALMDADADLGVLFAGISDGSTWISRLHGELPRAALSTDLTIAASANNTPVKRNLTAAKTTGKTPTCPPVTPCGAGGAGGAGTGGDSSGSSSGGSSGGCTVGAQGDVSTPLALGAIALGAAAALRRKKGRARR